MRRDSLSTLALYSVGHFSAMSSRFFCCFSVRFSGAFPMAYFEFLITCERGSFFSSPLGGRPLPRLIFGSSIFALRQNSLRTLSSDSMAHCMTWNGSTQRSADPQYFSIHFLIHFAPSQDTSLMALQRSGPSCSKKSFSTSSPYPSWTHTTLPRSWSTTTVM